ncbi:MAG: GNAT family N-acetyltransferase [Prolixibacteraceae bacterium]|nr:GNAT family N-acetyltransferase [Prolixibacteraceae bacterium]
MDTKIVLCDFFDLKHREAVIMLINAYIRDEMGGGTLLSEPKQIDLVEGLKNHPKAIVLLAESHGVFIGMLTAFENFSTFTARPMMNIHDVMVLETYRKKGVGRSLMNALIEVAEKRSCSRITLEVRTDNMPAQNLYRDLGFHALNPDMFYWRKYL